MPRPATGSSSVMEELGFTPSPAARRLSLGRTLTVGVVVSFLTRPQAAERLRGVDAVLTDSEFDLVIYNVESVQKRDHYLGTLAQSQRTDGLLVMSLPPPRRGRRRAGSGARSRSCSSTSTRRRSQACPASSATTSPAARSPLATCSISGHRAIGFVGDAVEDPFGFTSSRDRERGLDARAGRRRGSRSRRSGSGSAPTAATRRATSLVGCSSRTDDPTAIFAASDTQALGVIAAAHELGLHVPDDLSVIGYDDIEAADYVGLTTVRQQLFESGRAAPSSSSAEIDAPVRAAPDRRSLPPSSWSARPRHLRRRAVDEAALGRPRPADGFDTGGGFHGHASDRHRRAGRVVPVGAARGRRGRDHPGRCLRAPGAVSTPAGGQRRPPRRRPPRAAQPQARRRRRARRPRARTAGPTRSSSTPTSRRASTCRSSCPRSSPSSIPNVTWDIRQDQFTNLMTATPRLLSGDNPPDLIRLPSMVSLVKDGLLKNLDGYATAFGWDKWPPAAARPEPRRRRRHARLRLALRGGPQLQPDRCVLQQEARRSRSA